MSIISEAIETNHRISFEYFRIGTNNKKHFDKRKHFTSPWITLYNENNYYLVAYDRKRITYYRIDRITDVNILDEPRQGEEEYNKLKQELPFRTQSTFNIFGGERTTVTLRCPSFYYHVLVDKFGNDLVPRIDKNNNYCEVDVPVVTSDSFFGWLFSMKRKVQIVGPKEVKKKMCEMVHGASTYYRRDSMWQEELVSLLVKSIMDKSK